MQATQPWEMAGKRRSFHPPKFFLPNLPDHTNEQALADGGDPWNDA